MSGVSSLLRIPAYSQEIRMRVAALLFSVISFASQAATLRVGLEGSAGCTHSSLQSALSEAASNADSSNIIRLANNQSYTGIRVLLTNNKTLTIEGGYDNCTDTTSDPAQPTVLNALAGDSMFEVNLTGGTGLTLTTLAIQGGNTNFGGGIELRSGDVRLDNAQIRNNTAGFGGGVFVRGGGGLPARLYVGTNTRPSYIFNNTAIVGPGLSASGGGIYCDNGGSIFLTSGGITDNTAGTGGGIHVASGCSLQFDGAQPSFAPQVRNNSGGNGGGIYADAATVTTAGTSRIYIDGNVADSGAAINARNRADIDLRYAWIKGNRPRSIEGYAIRLSDATTKLVLRGGPLYVRCENGEFCSQVHGASLASTRALAAATGSRIELERIHVTGFTGEIGIVAGGLMLLSNSVVSGNTVSENLFRTIGTIRLNYSTVVNNTAFAGFADVNSGTAGNVELHASIVFNDGLLLARAPNLLNFSNGACPSVVNENSNADGVGRVTLISGLDANLLPTALGVATDVCATEIAFSPDLQNNPRPFDGPNPNLLGPQDAGAFERQSDDFIFRNGFE
jgi:hypothetical protein